MRYFLLLTFSIFSFADDHRISTDFSDCDGKVVNYYVSKIVSGGSVDGMMKAFIVFQQWLFGKVLTHGVNGEKALKLYLKKIEN